MANLVSAIEEQRFGDGKLGKTDSKAEEILHEVLVNAGRGKPLDAGNRREFFLTAKLLATHWQWHFGSPKCL